MEQQFYPKARPVAEAVSATFRRRTVTQSYDAILANPRVPSVLVSKPQSGRGHHKVPSRDLRSGLQLAADTVAIVVLSLVTGIAYQLVFLSGIGRVGELAWTGLLVALLCAGIGRLRPSQHVAYLTTGYDRFSDSIRTWTFAFGMLVFIIFALKASAIYSRGSVLSFYLAGLPAMAAWRVFVPPFVAKVSRKAGAASRNCIVIGDRADPSVDKFTSDLALSGFPTPTVIKFNGKCEASAWAHEEAAVLAQAFGVARRLHPGEIYLCAASVPSERLWSIGHALSIVPRAIYIVPDRQTASLVRCERATIGSHITVEIRREPLGHAQRLLKRGLDIAVSSVALLLLLPFFALIAAIIKFDSGGPVLFRQTRNGYRGKPFRIFKFRTMHVQEDGPEIRQVCRNDRRVTRVGRFLRRSSIDELPQLLNILMGQMSLVGPRPHAQAHDELYRKIIQNYEVRQHVKPGLTGWAQINGLRGETATTELMYRRIELDLWYAVNASVMLDLEILVRTAFAVVRPRNAY